MERPYDLLAHTDDPSEPSNRLVARTDDPSEHPCRLLVHADDPGGRGRQSSRPAAPAAYRPRPGKGARAGPP